MKFRKSFVALLLISLACSKESPVTLPTVTTKEASSITQVSAQTGGEVTSSGGGKIIARGVCYGLSSNPTIEDSVVDGGIGLGAFDLTLSDLITDQVYYVRAFATNAAGTAYGNEISFLAAEIDLDGDGIPDSAEAPECVQDPTC